MASWSPRVWSPALSRCQVILPAFLASVGTTVAPKASLGQTRLVDSAAALVSRADSLGSAETVADRRSSFALRRAAITLYGQLGEGTREAGQWLELGWAHAGMGQADSSLHALRQALEVDGGNGPTAALALSGLGSAWAEQGAHDSAATYLGRAIDVARRNHDRSAERESLTELGQVLSMMGRSDSAVGLLRRGLQLAWDLRDRVAEGKAAAYLAEAYGRIGQVDSALGYHTRSIVLHRGAGDPRDEAVVLRRAALFLREVGRVDSAVVLLRLALDIARTAGDAGTAAWTLRNLADLHAEAGRMDSARATLHALLPIWSQLGHRAGEFSTLNSIGTAWLRSGQLDSAQRYLHQARRMAAEPRNVGWLARLDQSMVALARSRGDADSAFGYAHSALALAREGQEPVLTAEALTLLGSIYHRMARPTDLITAAAYYDSAAVAFRAATRSTIDDPTRLGLARAAVQLYRIWTLGWAARHGEVGTTAASWASLAVADRGRAQAMRDLMHDTTATAVGVDDNLVEEGRRLAAEVVGPRSALLVYQLTSDTLLTWLAVGSGKVTLFRRPATPDSVARWVGEYRARLGVETTGTGLAIRGGPLELQLAAPIVGPGISPEQSGARLANLLVPPEVDRDAEQWDELLVIPQGSLALVPFAALPTGPRGVPLGARVALRYGPSLATVARAERAARPIGRGERSKATLVVGNPAMPELKDARGERARLVALPGAEAEADTIAALFDVAPFKGGDATEATIRQRLSTAPVAHLATHAFAYSGTERARESFVAFAADSAHDGRLTVADVMDDPSLRLTAELVVLSACQTGLGNLDEAEGTVGLQRAFLAKGARSVLVSLWNVSDDATRALMVAFYRHWLRDADQPTKAAALRRAQEEVRRTPGWSHPRFWAGFQLVGAG